MKPILDSSAAAIAQNGSGESFVGGSNVNAAMAIDIQVYAERVAECRKDLLKFARLQLRNDDWAEDAVSETVVAALSKPTQFAQKSQLKTYLIGILKHKLVDALRVQAKTVTLITPDDEDAVMDPLDAVSFRSSGHYVEPPQEWTTPDAQLQERQFLKVLEACLEGLPPVQARLFLMREWLELSSDECCKTLALSPTNLYVQLHRARLRLRDCLSLNWFGEK